jgi:hypothetical protein
MVLVKSPDEGVPPEVANAATKPVEQQGERPNPHNTKDFEDVDSILTGAATVPVAAVSRREQPRSADRAAAASLEPAAAQPASADATPKTSGELPPPAGKPAPPSLPLAPLPIRRYGMWLALSVLMGVALAAAVVIAGSLFRSRGSLVAHSDAPGVTSWKSPAPAAVAASAEKTPPETESPPSDNAKTIAKPAATDSPVEPAPLRPDTKVEEKQPDPLRLVTPSKTTDKSEKAAIDIGKDPLGRFGNVLEGGKNNPLPAPEVPAVPETSIDEGPSADAAPAAPRPPPRTVDIASRLVDPLAAIDVPGVPLTDFLADLSSLSTIPITLNPEGFALVGLSASTPVSLKAENTTVGESLAEALAPLHLEYQIAGDQVIVSLGSKLEDRAFAVDDLTGKNEEQVQLLAQWVTELVEPAIWKDGDEDGPSLTPGASQFAVRASDRTCAGVLLLMEKLRVARGLALRTKQPAEVFRLESRSARASARLTAPISLNYSHPTLLVVILKRLEKEGRVRILVDWRALAAEGWNADGEGILSVENKPLGDALTELLKPMDLAWRAVDEQTVQVTTLTALDQILELEVYPVGKLAANAAEGEALLARLQNAVASPGTDEAEGAMRFDSISGCIIASLPQPKQRVVEKLLAEWAREPK